MKKGIDKVFSRERMEQTRAAYDAWWEKTNDRPVIGMVIKNRVPDLPKPKVSLISQRNCNDLSVSIDDLLDAVEYEVCSYEYIGDAYPRFGLDCFGPGVTAAFLGARLDNSTGNVWFRTDNVVNPDELHFKFDEDNVWFQRIKNIMLRASERFEGKIVFGMPDLGGIMDVLNMFRPGENLIYDLYDYEEDIKRLSSEIFTAWFNAYDKFSEYLNQKEYGYTDWCTLLSSKKSYVIQSDFSYMVGPEIFDEYVYPNLKRFTEEIPRTIYHMDGVGEIRHLYKLLALDKLTALQWVPGAGKLPCDQYPEIYEKAEQADKQIQIPTGDLEVTYNIFKQLDKKERINRIIYTGTDENRERDIELLKKMHVI